MAGLAWSVPIRGWDMQPGYLGINFLFDPCKSDGSLCYHSH